MMKDREFTIEVDGEKQVRVFKRPSQKILNKAELIFRAKFSEGLRAGVLLSAEATKVLKERGLWDSEQEAEEKALRNEVADLEDKLGDATLSNEEGKSVCEKIAELRTKLAEHSSIVSSTLENTCEALGNDERNQYITAECVYFKSGQKVYKDVDDFKERKTEPGAIDSYREAIIATLESAIGRDLPSDLTEEYTENKWLNERKLVGEEAEALKEEPKKKKRAKKKKSSE